MKTDSYLLSSVKNIWYFFLVLTFKDLFLNKELGIKIFRFVSVISSIFIILQNVFLKFGIFIRGFIPFLEVTNIWDYAVKNHLTYLRPTGFFGEPSSYGFYVGLYMILSIYLNEGKLCSYNLIIMIGMVMSASTLSFGMLTIYFISLLIFNVKNHQERFYKYLCLLSLIMIMFICFGSNYLIKGMKRFDFHYMIEDRLPHSNLIDKLVLTEKIIGIGYGFYNCFKDVFMPEFIRVFASFGFIGIILHYSYLFSLLKIHRNLFIILAIVISSFFQANMLSMNVIFVISVITLRAC